MSESKPIKAGQVDKTALAKKVTGARIKTRPSGHKSAVAQPLRDLPTQVGSDGMLPAKPGSINFRSGSDHDINTDHHPASTTDPANHDPFSMKRSAGFDPESGLMNDPPAGDSPNALKAGAGNAIEGGGKAAQKAGQGIQASGKGLDVAGKGMQVAGKTAKTAGKGLDVAGKGMQQGGSAIGSAGDALSASGLGAVAGVPLSALGKTAQAGGAVTSALGKGLNAAGQGADKAGGSASKASKSIQGAGEKVNQAGESAIAKGSQLKTPMGQSSPSPLKEAFDTKLGPANIDSSKLSPNGSILGQQKSSNQGAVKTVKTTRKIVKRTRRLAPVLIVFMMLGSCLGITSTTLMTSRGTQAPATQPQEDVFGGQEDPATTYFKEALGKDAYGAIVSAAKGQGVPREALFAILKVTTNMGQRSPYDPSPHRLGNGNPSVLPRNYVVDAAISGAPTPTTLVPLAPGGNVSTPPIAPPVATVRTGIGPFLLSPVVIAKEFGGREIPDDQKETLTLTSSEIASAQNLQASAMVVARRLKEDFDALKLNSDPATATTTTTSTTTTVPGSPTTTTLPSLGLPQGQLEFPKVKGLDAGHTLLKDNQIWNQVIQGFIATPQEPQLDTGTGSCAATPVKEFATATILITGGCTFNVSASCPSAGQLNAIVTPVDGSPVTTTTTLVVTTPVGSTPSAPTPSALAGKKVLIIGDSLMADPRFQIELQALAQSSGAILTVDGLISRSLDIQGNRVEDGVDALKRHQAAGEVYDKIVFGLGTNNSGGAGAAEDYKNDLAAFMATAGKTVPVYGIGPATTPVVVDAEAIRQVLKTTKYPNLTVGDWNSKMSPSYLAGDQVHYNREGSKMYAQFVFDTIKGTTVAPCSVTGPTMADPKSQVILLAVGAYYGRVEVTALEDAGLLTTSQTTLPATSTSTTTIKPRVAGIKKPASKSNAAHMENLFGPIPAQQSGGNNAGSPGENRFPGYTGLVHQYGSMPSVPDFALRASERGAAAANLINPSCKMETSFIIATFAQETDFGYYSGDLTDKSKRQVNANGDVIPPIVNAAGFKGFVQFGDEFLKNMIGRWLAPGTQGANVVQPWTPGGTWNVQNAYDSGVFAGVELCSWVNDYGQGAPKSYSLCNRGEASVSKPGAAGVANANMQNPDAARYAFARYICSSKRGNQRYEAAMLYKQGGITWTPLTVDGSGSAGFGSGPGGILWQGWFGNAATSSFTGKVDPTTQGVLTWMIAHAGKAPYADVVCCRFGIPLWPGGTQLGFNSGTPRSYPAGTQVFDCSGFIVAGFRQVGIDLVAANAGATSGMHNNPNLIAVTKETLIPGDLIVYNASNGVGHVVIYLGDGKSIEARPTGGVVIKEPNWDRVKSYQRVPIPELQAKFPWSGALAP